MTVLQLDLLLLFRSTTLKTRGTGTDRLELRRVRAGRDLTGDRIRCYKRRLVRGDLIPQ